MGTRNTAYWKGWLSVFPRRASSTALAAENSRVLLLMQPLEKFLETRVGQDGFYRIESVPKLVMTPGLVDKILAGMARWHDLGPAFAARHHVMSPRRDRPFTERARIGHRIFIGSIANHSNIENGGRSGNRTHDRPNLQPLSRRCTRLCRTSSSVGGGSEIRTRDGVNHTCFPGKLLVYPDSLQNRSKWSACRVMLPGSALI
jgi:hypothetical protein